ncbi:hypothetical protein F5X96DRAFT_601694 [Biscogniauxia mediterranea]|nr:hypothetical protein F5X96DRAFT_601694 [Biscogniauxia mediterranea]
MDRPGARISGVITALTQGTEEDQQKALDDYFLPSAYFIHPFCRVPSFDNIKLPFTSHTINSRWLVQLIYQWYRILSPEVKLSIDSTSFDKNNNLLYVTMHQVFTLWFVPFSLWQADVKLVTVLELEHLPVDGNNRPVDLSQHQPGTDDDFAIERSKRYFIKGQEDHYQVDQFLKFVAPWGASLLWVAWQLLATLVCAVCVAVFRPVKALIQRAASAYGDQTFKRH